MLFICLISFLLRLGVLILCGLLLLGEDLHQLFSKLVLEISCQSVDFLIVSRFEIWDLFQAVENLRLELFDLCEVVLEVVVDDLAGVLFLSIVLARCLLIVEA